MITMAFLLISILLFLLLALFDAHLFHLSIIESLRNILISEISAGRYIVFVGAVFGLIGGFIIDIRLFLNKRRSKDMQGNKE
ncbi:hypothetical protein [Bacillus sp. JJ1764]|uniref:hypothetical protein n=1 Tax=Bacillus sp. JJ1764 TaxID=3122964 RepID=UPI002FFF3EDC